jgi:hypothetical protein
MQHFHDLVTWEILEKELCLSYTYYEIKIFFGLFGDNISTMEII